MRCKCGQIARVGASFCDRCGLRLSAVDLSPSGSAELDDRSSGLVERRYITVIFCDLVGSTALAEKLGDEEWYDVVKSFQATCFETISQAGGFVAQYLGDGVLAYFGYPVAREQDARAAVHAGLNLVQARGSLRRIPGQSLPPVRVGIHSGFVLASDVGSGETRQRLAIGSVPNVAARVQNLAPRDGVVISESTHMLVRGFFACDSLGPHAVRGLDHPLPVHLVTHSLAVPDQIELPFGGAVTPLIGRDPALNALMSAWQSAEARHGQVALIEGEAGMGKSRLIRELRTQLATRNHELVQCRGAPQSENSPFFPILDLARRAWKLDRAASESEKTDVLVRAVKQLPIGEPDALALLGALLGIAPPDGTPALAVTAERRKQKTIALLTDWVVAMSHVRPLLLVIEDVHWVDPSTLELLDAIVARIKDEAVLAVFLQRPGVAHEWPQGVHVFRLELGRLDQTQALKVIRHVSGSHALDPSWERHLIESCDGVPLYLEEMTRALVESRHPLRNRRLAAGSNAGLVDIPATLYESLVARFDLLGPLRELAQLGAVLGRAFSFEAAQALSGIDPPLLASQLAHLVQADVLRAHGSAEGATYVFKHALLHEAAHNTLLQSQRRDLHARAAALLETRFVSTAKNQPELIAHHWAEAKQPVKAARWLLQAGKASSESSAYAEAVALLQRGLDMIADLEDPQRERLEGELCLALGPALVATRGYADPEVARIYGRARELCVHIDDDRWLYAALSGFHLFHQSRGELTSCEELARERALLATRLNDSTLHMHVLETMGTVAVWRGDLVRGLDLVRLARDQYVGDRDAAIASSYGTDSRVVCLAYEGQALWFLGYPDQAVSAALQAVAYARQLGHAHSLALALAFAGMIHLLRREFEQADPLVEETIALSAEQKLKQWWGTGLFMRGLILGSQQRFGEALGAMGEGANQFRAAGARIGGRFFAGSFGETLLAAGMGEQAGPLMDMALAEVAACEDKLFDPESLRIKGEIALAVQKDPSAAESLFQDARRLAAAQSGRGFELRASLSLARLWRNTEREHQIAPVLAPLVRHFTEGASTHDVREAVRLLGECG